MKILASNWSSVYQKNAARMTIEPKKNRESEEQEWENPQNPGEPSDARDKEQVVRQYEEAKRRKDNLTEKDHIDKPKPE